MSNSFRNPAEFAEEKFTVQPAVADKEEDIHFFSENGVKLIYSGTREALLKYLLFNGGKF